MADIPELPPGQAAGRGRLLGVPAGLGLDPGLLIDADHHGARRRAQAGVELIEGTVDHHASQRWPALEEVTITWRGSYGYLTGYLSEDDDTIKLCRIQYLGGDDEWAFAIWQSSSDSYTSSVLLDGRPTGHPRKALDTACTLYLSDTSHPDEPDHVSWH